MHRILFPILLLLAATPRLAGPGDGPILGFTAEGSAAQFDLEERFAARLDPSNLDAWMRHMTSRPQHVGSPWGRANAEWVAGLFREWGFDAEVVRYDVLFPTPVERAVELVAPTRYVARLDEPELEGDATSRVRTDMLPPYNAYSADGDVEAELVYVNYGIPDDYEELARMGIDVAGKIVIARYGGSWRGIKPKVAAEHGAVGCILYSDPLDDGYWQGDVYPEGPYRMEWGTQRGSVADMPTYPGDPLTPFVGATPDAERLSVDEAPTLMRIPVLPISYGDALPLLEALGGRVAPPAWRGALPLTYHVGPGPARVHLRLRFDRDLAPAFNVIARLEGADFPDEWVIRGNHRDAWVFGAADPASGHVAMMEEARVIGELAKEGHRPRRTIVYASWDAEEPGLLGSTEWVEHHADRLRERAVAYLNTDGSGRGFLGIGGSHALEPFINEVARSVDDPQTAVSVWDRVRAKRRVDGEKEADSKGDLRISPLGSGSDYTPFLQHLGIPTLNLGFGGESGGGSYHSIYDSYDWYVRFGDPGFAYGVALAEVAGRATLRLANADVLPFRFRSLAAHVARYVDEVTRLADTRREETARTNALLRDRAYTLAADPKLPYVPPPVRPEVPYLNFAPLLNVRDRLSTAAARADSALAAAAGSESLNGRIYRLERLLTDPDGLPGRPWFRHLVYAPGYYTGYGVKTLPGVREAIEQRDYAEAERQIVRIARVLGRAADELARIADGR
jgi:N-acetylated-alpha-linked acidic dipeptidase